VTHATIEMFGLRISNVDYGELCDCLDAWIAEGTPGYIVTPNVDHVCKYHRDAAFRRAYDGAFLLLADGMPIIWASHLLRRPLKQKLSGSDLVPQLAGHCAERGHGVYFLGGSAGTAQRSAEILKARHPGLDVRGVDCPPLGFEQDAALDAGVLERLRDAQPAICFVALGSPKQELWLHGHVRDSGVPVVIGVGATFDFIAGTVRRAPRWVQRLGLEWLWRLAHEPRRLWRRYLVEDALFFKLLWRELRGGQGGTADRPSDG